MTLTETKIIQVANDPSTINDTNSEWGSFGWSVMSVQITHSQDTKTFTRGLDFFTGDSTVETTTINYATITYQRDRRMQHYEEIVGLEKQYLAVKEKTDEKIDRIMYDDQKPTLFNLTKPLDVWLKKKMGMNPLSKSARATCAQIAAQSQTELDSLRRQAEKLL